MTKRNVKVRLSDRLTKRLKRLWRILTGADHTKHHSAALALRPLIHHVTVSPGTRRAETHVHIVPDRDNLIIMAVRRAPPL